MSSSTAGPTATMRATWIAATTAQRDATKAMVDALEALQGAAWTPDQHPAFDNTISQQISNLLAQLDDLNETITHLGGTR